MLDQPAGTAAAPPPAHLLPGAIDQYLSTRVPVCLAEERASDIRARLVGKDHEVAEDVAVCDRLEPPHRLVGLIPVSRLLAADGERRAADLLDADPPVVVEGLDREQAAWKAVQHGESSLAVVATDGAFRGLVRSPTLLGVLLREHDEDFARLGGYLASTRSARLAVEEPVARRLWHRLPWLALGLAGAAMSAWLVGLFEGRLVADVRLAFFIPGVVYLADAVGTQTEALVVRGLSVGTPVRTALRLETITGPALGLLLGLVSLPAIWAVMGDVRLAATVSIALVAACSVATLVAAGLPILLARTGRDPAFGSGPLATVLQDLLSLVIYFAVAVLVLGEVHP
ncbi:magnesium transporter [Nocardioides euryhalodurans]|uniref:Magnesium transporter n=2 Tax=Nocardioides euryhalodurans TaxID=2518370 RepID=A0A4P7GPY1_9ACTN|nr:magnesium transporter [Nocardioides euryhalodurans]